ncbi:hypothetical protein D9611_013497 [Ephemerocybe angulata]|uniref:Uncharacterized protein n=1 Tax=Ephemerocybe angulata TaxID=980116 RepID=A0A8H5BT96_9AGAR|nr:hypothetical protein D9611_013497 [Tulosesus angulatus]
MGAVHPAPVIVQPIELINDGELYGRVLQLHGRVPPPLRPRRSGGLRMRGTGTRKGIEALAKFLKESGAFTRDGRTPNKRDAPRWEDEREPGVEEDKESDEYG